MEIRMPENAKKVIETLEVAGYEAYIVGGCVRTGRLGYYDSSKTGTGKGVIQTDDRYRN